MRPHFHTLVLWACCLSAPAHAQGPQAVPVGARVRVTAAAVRPDPIVGTILDRRGDTLWILIEATHDSVAFASPQIINLEVPAGRRSHERMGTAMGAIAGAAGGVDYAFREGADPVCSGVPGACDLSNAFRKTARQKAVMYGVLGGFVGAIPGWLLGEIIRTDVWAPAGLNAGHFVGVVGSESRRGATGRP